MPKSPADPRHVAMVRYQPLVLTSDPPQHRVEVGFQCHFVKDGEPVDAGYVSTLIEPKETKQATIQAARKRLQPRIKALLDAVA